MSKIKTAFIGRCPDCHAIRAIDMDKPDELVRNGYMVLVGPFEKFTPHDERCPRFRKPKVKA